jgi:hypothetical protein
VPARRRNVGGRARDNVAATGRRRQTGRAKGDAPASPFSVSAGAALRLAGQGDTGLLGGLLGRCSSARSPRQAPGVAEIRQEENAGSPYRLE